MKVTKWSIIDPKTFKKTLNHIQDGWAEGEKPLPIKSEFANQHAWQNHNWSKSYRYLVDGKITGGWKYSTKKLAKNFFPYAKHLLSKKKNN